MMRILGPALLVVLSACAPGPVAAPAAGNASLAGPRLSGEQAAHNFVRAAARVEPVAERECLARTAHVDCDFRIVVDDRPGQPPNAFQTLDKSGRPIVAFTVALIADARNPDELAFIMGHEAAHHISDHLARQENTAWAGAMVFGTLAILGGADDASVELAEQIGATLGSRTFSKEYELEADALGTLIAAQAGYDPLKGAQYFARVADPGNVFLGTHPPNAARLRRVQATVAAMNQGS